MSNATLQIAAVRAAIEAWATPDGLEFNIVDPRHRSNSTTTILTGAIDGERLRVICERDAGLTVGIGLGDFAGRSFRIGHMGHLNPAMVLGTIATIEAALTAMDAPIGGSGVAAASSAVSSGTRSTAPARRSTAVTWRSWCSTARKSWPRRTCIANDQAVRPMPAISVAPCRL